MIVAITAFINAASYIAPMALLGDKISCKQMAKKARVPVFPGSDGAIEDVEQAAEVAGKIGYPVIVKASAGGGGRGMKVARDAGELAHAFVTARTEAKAAFGDDAVYIEKYLEKPRHIEIQVLGDGRGNAIHLGERDCSLQRRHQKLVEEAPSPVVDAETRARMGAAALRAQGDRSYFLRLARELDDAVLHLMDGELIFASRRQSMRLLGQQLLRDGKLEERTVDVREELDEDYYDFAWNPPRIFETDLPFNNQGIGGRIPAIRYNRVEGLALGVRLPELDADDWEQVRPVGQVSYATAMGAWRFAAGVEARPFSGPTVFSGTRVGLRYRLNTATNDDWKMPWTENTLAAFFVRNDFFDYYEVQGWSVYANQPLGRRVQISAGFLSEEHRTLARETSWSLFGDGSFRPNPPADEGLSRSVIAALDAGNVHSLRDRPRGTALRAEIEVAPDAFGSELTFTRLVGELRHYGRIDRTNSYALRIRGGFATDDVPLQKTFSIGGPGSVRGYPLNWIWADQMVLANAEYTFSGTDIILDDVDFFAFVQCATFHAACDDRTTAFDGEDIFDRHQEGLVGVAFRCRNPLIDLRHQFLNRLIFRSLRIHAVAFNGGQRGTLDNRCFRVEVVAFQQFGQFHFDQFNQFRVVHLVGFVQEDHHCRHFHLTRQQHMLAGLRHGAIRCADDEDCAVHLGGTRNHVLDVVTVSRAIHMGVVTGIRLVFHMTNRNRDTTFAFFRRVVDVFVVHTKVAFIRHVHHFGDGRRQRGFPMVNVTDGTDVDVRLTALELLFSHCCMSLCL